MTDDPYAVLGVGPDVSEAELRVARRRLAMALHPDHAGGTTDQMQRLNLAFDAVLADIASPIDGAGGSGGTAGAPHPATRPDAPATAGPVPRPGGRVAHDVASFTIESLPVEAFEALSLVASWLGEVVNDEEPYQLDVVLGEPFECWCRLDLVPDAGASTVAVTLASLDGRPVPDLDAVRDAWVAELNTLGRPT